MSRPGILCLLAISFLAAYGCGLTGAPADPRIAQWRAACVLTAEPEGSLGVLDVRETLVEQKASELPEVVLVGRIGGVPDPWGRGEASFVVEELSVCGVEGGHDHHDHDAASCPFCSKKINPLETLALVRFVDAEGLVLPVSARDVFPVDAHQTVVVRGRAAIDPAGQLLVTARELYVRR